MGYGTQKSVSYEVQPTRYQQHFFHWQNFAKK
jgi:hypothetical protein